MLLLVQLLSVVLLVPLLKKPSKRYRAWVFSNESGLGSAPIAAAAAKTEEPVEQGLISMTGTFTDTIIICTLTGLSIIVTEKWTVAGLEGAPLTQAAFSSIFGTPGALALTFCLVLFAFTTILGWSYYGERCFQFTFEQNISNFTALFFIIIVALGGFLKLSLSGLLLISLMASWLYQILLLCLLYHQLLSVKQKTILLA